MKRLAALLLFVLAGGTFAYVRYWPSATRLFDRACDLERAGENGTAKAELELLVREYPHHAVVPKAKGKLREIDAKKRYQEAKLASDDGNYSRAQRLLTEVLEGFADTVYYERARSELKAITERKCQAEARDAESLLRRGRFRDARAEFERLIEKYGGTACASEVTSRLPRIVDAEVKALYVECGEALERGRYDEALGCFRSVCDDFGSTDYGGRACEKVRNWLIRVRVTIIRGQVGENKPDGRPWDPRFNPSEMPPDPMVKVLVDGRQVLATGVHNNTYEPSWNYGEVVEVKPNAQFTFEMWDYDFGDPDKIGSWGGSLEEVLNTSVVAFSEYSGIYIYVSVY